ncbi:MAG: ATP-binding protein [Nitrospirota bacterium]
MKLTIFSRLVIGYLFIFILAMAVSIYAILQLRQLETVTHSILKVENRLVDYEQKISGLLLSMMRYERKFIIIKDEGLYSQFLIAKKDFDKYLNQAMSVVETAETRNLLNNIKQYHNQYQSLFNDELTFLRSGREYPGDNYKQEKEQAVNEIMKNMKELKEISQKNTYDKVKKLGEAEVNASKVAIIIGIISLILGTVISIFITLNITKPLSIIKNRTGDIARGDFGDDLDLSSPPEIKELAHSFNLMCTKLKEVDKLKSDFFSLMSHELRTPLTTIKEGTNLFLEGLKDEDATAKQRRLLTIINEECIRMITLVDSLLDLSKMEAGMMTFNFIPINIVSLIDTVAREIEPLAETNKITIKKELQDDLPQIKIDCDRILQVLRNLIGNAVKFTPEGGQVRICASNSEQYIKVSVTDTGSGISKDNLISIFEKYHQESSNKIKGTGLGLSIVKHIIDAHGGKVWVESSSEHGSTFSFVLPA